jgi:hypothetical protein
MKHNKAQAAIELAVFGAVLIFILGSIVRSAVSNGYVQNQGFTSMRMAMLDSWKGTIQNKGFGHAQNVARNNASVLFVEDRLSPDFNKYGPLDRTPYIAQGAGTFTYNLFYPVDASEKAANVPVMDVYINGQHFPFTTAIYTSTTLTPPTTCAQYAVGSCLYNQCTRNQRDWSGGNKLFFQQIANGDPSFDSSAGDAAFDLTRNNDSTQYVPTGLRPYIAWQWSSVTATDAGSIGLDASSQKYPQYDIDGRLKAVVIYDISSSSNSVTVSYEDFQNGDIDTTWDFNSCGPKPGLQQNSQVFSFTKQGTYMQLLEGKLYDPESGRFVRSANKKDTIDLVQRTIQLSNNTGRFCDANGNVLSTVASDGVTSNPVEVCIPVNSPDNCFSSQYNIKSTCYDESNNKVFVRSRLEDLRGHYWFTGTSGNLNVH